MKHLVSCAAVLLMSAMLLIGCGGSGKEPVPTAPPEAAPVSPSTQTPPAKEPELTVPPAAPAAAPASASAPVDPLLQKLIGTTWMVGDFQATFQDAKTVLVKGGDLAALYPNGYPATYTFENGTLEVTVMDQKTAATWDGEKLVVDGVEAVRQ